MPDLRALNVPGESPENIERCVGRATRHLRMYAAEVGLSVDPPGPKPAQVDTCLGDLLYDLMHAYGRDTVEASLGRGLMHYSHEAQR